MIGVIAGDVIGSIYELAPTKSTTFQLFHPLSHFTDDTVLTVATASAILRGTSYETAYRDYGQRYPRAGYGKGFRTWLSDPAPRPYHSLGNGSAMRVAPVAMAFDDIDRVLAEARRSAEVTHNHPDGVNGAQAIALAVFLARTGASKDQICDAVTARFGYDLNRSISDIRPGYAFDVTCPGTVPEAIIAFVESTSFESAIRLAISLGGDSDTLASMAGGIADAFYGYIDPGTVSEVRQRVADELLDVVDEFQARFAPSRPVR
jgi:ADP-ribosylglycohydrolase